MVFQYNTKQVAKHVNENCILDSRAEQAPQITQRNKKKTLNSTADVIDWAGAAVQGDIQFDDAMVCNCGRDKRGTTANRVGRYLPQKKNVDYETIVCIFFWGGGGAHPGPHQQPDPVSSSGCVWTTLPRLPI